MIMRIAPEDLWATLPVTLKRQIADDIAVVLAEVFRDVRADPSSVSMIAKRLFTSGNRHHIRL